MDGVGDARSVRNSMAFLLAFGLTLPELQDREPAFRDIHAYLLTLEAPRWPFGALDGAKRSRGLALFRAQCERCHGSYECAQYPSHVEPVASVGTDATRAARYRALEVAYVNASWFGGDHPQAAGGGYLAPNLTGLWASAPYFHNGSVPTLQQVLNSQQRPRYFRRRGTDGAEYDAERVGWKVDVLAAGQVSTDARAVRDQIYDTTLPGLGNAGDALTEAERADLLEYLKSL